MRPFDFLGCKKHAATSPSTMIAPMMIPTRAKDDPPPVLLFVETAHGYPMARRSFFTSLSMCRMHVEESCQGCMTPLCV